MAFSPDCDRSHLLSRVIDNIRMKGDFYQVATLPFKVREKDKLYKIYRDFGYFNPPQSQSSKYKEYKEAKQAKIG